MTKISGMGVQMIVVVLAALLGGLLGFAYTITVGHYGYAQGAAPLLANALGAAIGASITLWATDRRVAKAEDKENAEKVEQKKKKQVAIRAELLIISGNLKFLADQMDERQVTGSTLTAVLVLEQRLSSIDHLQQYLLDVGLSDHFVSCALDFPHALRILRELQARAERAPGSIVVGTSVDEMVVELRRIEAVAQQTSEAVAHLRF